MAHETDRGTHLDDSSVTLVDVERVHDGLSLGVPIHVPTSTASSDLKRPVAQGTYQWQTVVSSDALSTCPAFPAFGFQLNP